MSRWRWRTARPAGLIAAVSLSAIVPAPARSQTDVVVRGRVYATDTGAGIPNAIATLDGYGSVLTSDAGSFRFDGVAPGRRSLRIEAFGYEDASLELDLAANTVVDVPLTPAPLELDSLRIELETLDFDGRVMDPEEDLRVVGAEVLSSQGHEERSNAHGDFDLDDVYRDVPLRIVIREFGYLPLDTTLIPDDDERHEFDMAVDSAVQRVIDMQVERIADVTRGRSSVIRSLDREGLLRFSGTFTVYDMLLYEYGRRLQRVQCIVVDEEQIQRSRGWRSYLSTMLPEELERVEFLFGGGMLRIYSREFIRRMSVGRVELTRPLMFPRPRVEPLCR